MNWALLKFFFRGKQYLDYDDGAKECKDNGIQEVLFDASVLYIITYKYPKRSRKSSPQNVFIVEADVIFHGTNTNISIYFRNIYDLPKISSGCLVDITNETPSATVSAFVDNNLVKLVKEDLARVSLKGQLNEKHLKEVPDKKYKSILMQYQLSGPPTGFSTMDYYSP